MNATLDLGRMTLNLLPPENHEAAWPFAGGCDEPLEYQRRIAAIQQCRGAVYVEDQAIPASELDADGRHLSSFDADCWHLYLTDERDEQVFGCIRARFYSGPVQVNDLRLAESIARMPAELASEYRAGVAEMIGRAQTSGIAFAEVGGWALRPEVRRSTAGMSLVMGVWSLGRILGGGIAVSPTTTKHHTSRIHRRFGGFGLSLAGRELAPYWDDYHRCEMEMIAFDSRTVSDRHLPMVDTIQLHLQNIVRGATVHEQASASFPR